MENELNKQILESIKDFKIIAHGSDQQIINKIVSTIKDHVLSEIGKYELPIQHLVDSETQEYNSYNLGILRATREIKNLITNSLS